MLSFDGLGFVIGYAAGLVMFTGLLVMLRASLYAMVKNRWMPGLPRAMWLVWVLLVALTSVARLFDVGSV